MGLDGQSEHYLVHKWNSRDLLMQNRLNQIMKEKAAPDPPKLNLESVYQLCGLSNNSSDILSDGFSDLIWDSSRVSINLVLIRSKIEREDDKGKATLWVTLLLLFIMMLI